MPLGEIFQDGWTIIADCRQLKSLRLKPLLCRLQLHELRFAERSPIGGAEEQYDGTLRPLQRLVGVFMAELIRQRKRRRLLTDLHANGRSRAAIRGRLFLTTRKRRRYQDKKDSNRNLHPCSGIQSRFFTVMNEIELTGELTAYAFTFW